MSQNDDDDDGDDVDDSWTTIPRDNNTKGHVSIHMYTSTHK